MNNITLIIITKNASLLIRDAILSVKGLTDYIIIVDNDSTDNTREVVKRYNAEIFSYSGQNLGEQRSVGLKHAKTKWVLFLDADERLSPELQSEIKRISSGKSDFDGYSIPFLNHFLGRPLHHGGEDYSMIRFFRKDKVVISPNLVHEGFAIPSGKVGKLKGKIVHYSYRSLRQMFLKFHDYALREAQQKFQKKERSSMKKIIAYPLHMFWARFIKDKGYRDGFSRILLDIGFAYMEFMTYVVLAFKNITSEKHL